MDNLEVVIGIIAGCMTVSGSIVALIFRIGQYEQRLQSRLEAIATLQVNDQKHSRERADRIEGQIVSLVEGTKQLHQIAHNHEMRLVRLETQRELERERST